MNKKRNMVLTLCLAALLTCGIAATNVAADDIIVVDDETASVVAVDTEDAVAADDTSFTPLGTEENIAVAEDAVTVWHSGTCGENMTWTLYNTGTMVIEGEGAITDISTWSEYKVLIKSVVFDARITTIPSYAFQDCIALTTITIPDACTTAYRTFSNAPITTVIVRESVTSIPSDIYSISTIEQFSVTDEDGDGYYDHDGVLYYRNNYKDEHKIVKYPLAKPLKGTYTIDDGTITIVDGAFRNMTEATEIIMPDSITSIEENAFYGCTKLTTATLPKYLTSISSYIFKNCSSLATLTVPDACTSVGYQSFTGTAITNVIVPESVTTIPSGIYGLDTIEKFTVTDEDGDGYYDHDGVLYYRNNYKDEHKIVKYPLAKPLKGTYTIDDGTITIVDGAFRNMTEATEIIMPDSITSIEENAFYGCTKLTTATLPKYLTSISSYIFKNCSSLATLTVPDACTSVGYQSFTGTAITNVIVPESVTTIPSGIYGLDTIEKFTVTDEDGDGYYDHDGVLYYRNNYKDEHKIVKYPLAKPLKGTYTIDDGTITICNSAFASKTEATEIIMPDSITSIEENAFYGCTKLTTATLPKYLTSISSYIFKNCSSLATLTVPDACTSVGYQSFTGTAITNVIVPESVTTIPSGIYGLDTIEKFTVTDEDGDGYYDHDGVLYYRNNYKDEHKIVKYPLAKPLKGTYTIDDGTITICNSAFASKTEATEIIMPDSITSIEENAFYGCTKLTTATLPKYLTSISSYIFKNCSSLATLTVPDACTSVGYQSFTGTAITNVILRDSVTTIPGAICSISTIQEFTVEDTDGDGFYALDGILYSRYKDTGKKYLVKCPAAKQLKGTYTVDAGTTQINDSSFTSMTQVDTVILPATLETIGKYAFQGCTKLESAYFYGGTPTVGDRAFNSVASGFTMYYIEGQSGWTTPTWNGYTTATWIPEGTTVTPDPEIYNATLLGNMQKYFSGYSVTLDSVADIDGDGTISRKDAMILARYLADWEGYADYFKLS